LISQLWQVFSHYVPVVSLLQVVQKYPHGGAVNIHLPLA